MDRNFYRAFITLWCILIAFNIYAGISAYYKGNWSGVIISAAMIGWLWKLIWRDYDESREDDNGY